MAIKLQNMKNSEITEQIKLFNWARSVREFIPELKLLHHIPNEGKRTNGALLKAAGMVAGVPDLSLPVARQGFNGLYIEMKFGNNKPTKDQVEFMAMLKDQGYKTAVAYSAEEARSLIRHYPKQVYWKSEATTLTAFLYDRDDMKEKDLLDYLQNTKIEG